MHHLAYVSRFDVYLPHTGSNKYLTVFECFSLHQHDTGYGCQIQTNISDQRPKIYPKECDFALYNVKLLKNKHSHYETIWGDEVIDSN